MKVYIELLNDDLIIGLWSEQDTPEVRGRIASIEIALLRAYGRHVSYPRNVVEGEHLAIFRRPRSTDEHLDIAKQVLAGFKLVGESKNA